MKSRNIFILIIFLLASCSSAPNEESIQTAIAETSIAESLIEEADDSSTEIVFTSTLQPTNTPRPTNTTAPTNTPEPTQEPTEEPEVGASSIIAKNFLASDEDNGVIVEVVRVLIGEKQAIINEFDMKFVNETPILKDKTTIVEFIFRIVNNTDKIIKFYFDSETIASVNGEQIAFDDYWGENYIWFGDDLSNPILPGSTVIGGLWTGIKRSSWDEITTISISIPEAFEPDNYSGVTGSFLLTFGVDNWDFEVLPEELK